MQKVAVITGAGSGIGESIALGLARENFKIILLGRNVEKLKEVSKKTENSLFLSCDLSDPKSVQLTTQEIVKKFPDIDTLVNNAGVIQRETFLDSSEESWFDQFNINLFGAVRITRGLWPLLKKNGGSIVNIASTLGLRPIAATSAYSASKAAMVNWTQCLALEGAVEKIRVNCICPGLVDTPIHSYWGKEDPESKAARASFDKAQPLGRMGKPQDIADAVKYVVGADWMTGSVLTIDGGISL